MAKLFKEICFIEQPRGGCNLLPPSAHSFAPDRVTHTATENESDPCLKNSNENDKLKSRSKTWRMSGPNLLPAEKHLVSFQSF